MNRSVSARTLLPALAAVVILGACDETTSGPRVPTRIDVVGGREQSAVVGTEAPDPLVVRVVDAAGRPVANVAVSFQVVAGGGAVTPPAAQTDADGVASTRWRLGNSASGIQRVEATVAGVAGPAAAFIAIGTPAAATQIQLQHQFSEGFVLPGQVIDSFTAVVMDAFGNRVRGVPVTWTARGGGSASPASGVTSVDGVVRARWTIGLRVDTVQTLHASFGTASTPPLVLSITHPPTTVQLVSGGGQSGVFGQPLPQPIVVRAVDPQGRPLQGALMQGRTVYGGTVTPFRSRTAADGTASLQWTLGPTLANQVMEAGVVLSELQEPVHTYITATAHP